MPKATMQFSKALRSGFGIQSGKIKVTGSRYKILQRVKNDGSLITPMCVLQWDVTKSLSDGTVLNEEDIEQKEFIYCWGSKGLGDDGHHKFSFHPAIGKSATDQDPEDQGPDIDSEGNTLTPTSENMLPFADSECMLLAGSLEKKGWKPEINDQCWAPNYVGMVLDVETVTKAVLCKELDIRYRPQEGRAEANDTIWKVAKIDVFPYEVKGSSKKQPGASTSKTTTSPSKANGEAPTDAEALAISTVKKVAESKEFKGKEGIQRSKFQAAVMTQLHRDKKAKEQQAVMKLVKDDEWIINAGGELNFIVDTDEGVMNFTTD